MNPFVKAMEGSRDMFDAQVNAWCKLAELDSETVASYAKITRDFAQQLPSVKQFSDWTELQREFGGAMWRGGQEALEKRGEILREMFEKSGTLAWSAFNAASEMAEMAEEEESTAA